MGSHFPAKLNEKDDEHCPSQQGKRSYYIASTFDDDKHHDESRVLRRLSDDYELCAYGLSQVRREWETCRGANAPDLMH